MPRYKNQILNRVYEDMLASGDNKASDLWLADGTPRVHGAAHRCYFWLGAGVFFHSMPFKGTPGRACYEAGKEWARREKAAGRALPKKIPPSNI